MHPNWDVAVKQQHVRGAGKGIQRRVNTVLDRVWAGSLQIYLWVIEHPEGIRKLLETKSRPNEI